MSRHGDREPGGVDRHGQEHSKNYGQTVAFAGTEFTTSGLLNTDSVTSVTLTSAGAAADATVGGSPYSIVPSAAVGTGLGNYTITYVNGNLTVIAAALTITASSGTITYGGTPPTITPSYSGFVNGDGPGSLTPPADLLHGGDQRAARRVRIAAPARGRATANYTISYVGGYGDRERRRAHRGGRRRDVRIQWQPGSSFGHRPRD